MHCGCCCIGASKDAVGIKSARKIAHNAFGNPIVLNLMSEQIGSIVSGTKTVTVMRLLYKNKEGGVATYSVERASTSSVFIIRSSFIG